MGDAGVKRKRKKGKHLDITNETLPTLTSKSDEAKKYISEDRGKENSPEPLELVKELSEENNFVENRLLLPNPVITIILTGLRPREVVLLAQTCQKLLLKIITIGLYQFLRVEGLDIPQNISEELRKRKIRYDPNLNVIIFSLNVTPPKGNSDVGDSLAVVNAQFIKFFNFPTGKYDLENDEIFLCHLKEGVSYILFGKVFSKSRIENGDLYTHHLALFGLPIQVSDDRERQVVFLIAKSKWGRRRYDVGALCANFDPQLENYVSYNAMTLNGAQWAFNSNEVKTKLVKSLKM